MLIHIRSLYINDFQYAMSMLREPCARLKILCCQVSRLECGCYDTMRHYAPSKECVVREYVRASVCAEERFETLRPRRSRQLSVKREGRYAHTRLYCSSAAHIKRR
jgi:hypothetical protein